MSKVGGEEGDGETERKSEDLPSVSRLLALVNREEKDTKDKTELKYLDYFQKKSLSSQLSYAHLKGLKDHYNHKGWWSFFLMFVMFGMISYQSILLGLVGGGVWNFSEYDWLLPLLLVQNLAQIVGLAVFVVKALFRDPK